MKHSFFVAMVLLAAPALAASNNPDQPYTGLEARALKALSPEQIDGLLEGRGMSLALAAELNGLPGPLHVLELSDKLALDEGQRAAVQTVFDRMNASARALGAEIVALEQELDTAFASGGADPAAVAALTARIGEKQGRLRAVHLVAHLEMTPLLSPHQRHVYARERGYGRAPGQGGQGGHGQH